MARKKRGEIQLAANQIMDELPLLGDQVFNRLFGDDPGPDAVRLSGEDKLAQIRYEWEQGPEARSAMLYRYTVPDPVTGQPMEEGLKKFRRLIAEAYPTGRPPDPPPPAPPVVFAPEGPIAMTPQGPVPIPPPGASTEPPPPGMMPAPGTPPPPPLGQPMGGPPGAPPPPPPTGPAAGPPPGPPPGLGA